MSSAVLWSLFPLGVGIGLLFYRRPDPLSLYTAIFTSLFLTWVAWQIPLDVVLQLGPFSLEIAPTQVIFGRNFTLGEAQRVLLTFIYFAQCMWLLGALLTKPTRLFAPVSLIAVGLFVAALSVQPFLYAALILAAVVLIFVPLLVQPGTTAGRGVQRFLKYQLFAVPCILFTGWLLTGVEASPGNLNLVLRAGLLLGLGFAFLLGLFPFHAWIPMLAREANPYVFGYFLFFMSAVASIFSLSFFDRYVWLRENQGVYQLLLFAGSLNVLLAGLWAGAERHLGRIFAFAVMAATGGLLQAIGQAGAAGVQSFFAMLLPQAWALWALALSISIFWGENKSLELASLQRSLRHHPLLTLAVLIALFAIAGLPFLGPFAAHLFVWRGLGERSVLVLALSLVGSLGLIGAALRVAFTWLGPTDRQAQPLQLVKDELGRPQPPTNDFFSAYVWIFFAVTAFAMLGYGLLPRTFLNSVPTLAAMFPQLFP